eukprot:g665.t1
MGTVNYFPDFIHAWNPDVFKQVGGVMALATGGSFLLFGLINPLPYVACAVTGLYWTVGLKDLNQKRHTVRRNFPVLGHMRYIMESLRPEIHQYFVEPDQGGRPFNRDQRAQVYQRAKNIDAVMPFGTRLDVYEEGYEVIVIGGPSCTQPYSAAILNISAMSYGALSDNAILALNGGAKLGNFYHNTGEGGVSRFHLQPEGDIVWNIGTGYFGCRNRDGSFSSDMFVDTVSKPQVKMVEIKLSQGAKPGHGGLLPGSKVTEIIAEARGVQVGEDCNSPPSHSAFSGPHELIEFVANLRELSGGKPIGFKMCVGHPVEFASIIRAILEVGVEHAPDFITIDGSEGGTGAAPPEFSNRIGMPLVEGLSLARNFLIGTDLKKDIKLIASGRVLNGFDLVRTLSLGADVCNSARGMMFALGCIQALQCGSNKCPTGIATQNPRLFKGLHVDDKRVRVRNYQHKTVHTALEIVGALGLNSPEDLKPHHVYRRIDGLKTMTFEGMYHSMEKGALLNDNTKTGEDKYDQWWQESKKILSSKNR